MNPIIDLYWQKLDGLRMVIQLVASKTKDVGQNEKFIDLLEETSSLLKASISVISDRHTLPQAKIEKKQIVVRTELLIITLKNVLLHSKVQHLDNWPITLRKPLWAMNKQLIAIVK